MSRIFAAVVLVAVFASPSLAQGLDHPWVNSNGVHISKKRAEALRECSIRAEQVPEHSYEESDLSIYRACMNDHGEVE
jgi:hypothetical protein